MTKKDKDKDKILVIRFNSIGDIVLTTPVLKLLYEAGYEVHYLMKSAYASVLEENPYVTKIINLESSLAELYSTLRAEGYSYIVDLHNNYRSKRVSSVINKPVFRLTKERVGLWLLTQFGIGKHQRKHIVERFQDVIIPLTGKGKDYSAPKYYLGSQVKPKEIDRPYMVIAVGAAYFTKQIPIEKIIDVINTLSVTCVLVGGTDDIEQASKIESATSKSIINLVGKLNISESAQVIESAKVVLSGDTGMMHIANAVGTPVVAVFGSTHPILGYSPYNPNGSEKDIIVQAEGLSCRPCTKQGKHKCPKGHFKCMMDLESKDIIDKIRAFI